MISGADVVELEKNIRAIEPLGQTDAADETEDLCSTQRRALAWLEEHGVEEIRHGQRILNRATVSEDWELAAYLLRLEGEE